MAPSLFRGPSPLRRRPLAVSPIVDRYSVNYKDHCAKAARPAKGAHAPKRGNRELLPRVSPVIHRRGRRCAPAGASNPHVSHNVSGATAAWRAASVSLTPPRRRRPSPARRAQRHGAGADRRQVESGFTRESRRPRVTSGQALQPLGVSEGTSRADPCRTGHRVTAVFTVFVVRTVGRTPPPGKWLRPSFEVPCPSVDVPSRFRRSSTGTP